MTRGKVAIVTWSSRKIYKKIVSTFIREYINIAIVSAQAETAKAALYLVSDQAGYVTGANIPVDDGFLL